MKLLFFGSPEVAVPFLEECAAGGDPRLGGGDPRLGGGHDVRAVVTQPDRPSGRGLALRPPPVKEAALRMGLKVLPPDRIYVDPDCGLKTRLEEEAKAKLRVMVEAVKELKAELCLE